MKKQNKKEPPVTDEEVDFHRKALTPTQVYELRRQYRKGFQMPELAKEYKVQYGTVYNAVKGKGAYKNI